MNGREMMFRVNKDVRQTVTNETKRLISSTLNGGLYGLAA
jgi:hypothetical protein